MVLVAATLGVPDGSSSVCWVLCVDGSYWMKIIKKKLSDLLFIDIF